MQPIQKAPSVRLHILNEYRRKERTSKDWIIAQKKGKTLQKKKLLECHFCLRGLMTKINLCSTKWMRYVVAKAFNNAHETREHFATLGFPFTLQLSKTRVVLFTNFFCRHLLHPETWQKPIHFNFLWLSSVDRYKIRLWLCIAHPQTFGTICCWLPLICHLGFTSKIISRTGNDLLCMH